MKSTYIVLTTFFCYTHRHDPLLLCGMSDPNNWTAKTFDVFDSWYALKSFQICVWRHQPIRVRQLSFTFDFDMSLSTFFFIHIDTVHYFPVTCLIPIIGQQKPLIVFDSCYVFMCVALYFGLQMWICMSFLDSRCFANLIVPRIFIYEKLQIACPHCFPQRIVFLISLVFPFTLGYRHGVVCLFCIHEFSQIYVSYELSYENVGSRFHHHRVVCLIS